MIMEKLTLVGHSFDPEPLNFATRLTETQDEFEHSHDYYELFIVTSGQIKHTCLNTTKVLSTGDAYIISPNVSHRFQRNQPCVHRDFLLSKQLVTTVCDFLQLDLQSIILAQKGIHFLISIDDVVYLEEKIANFLTIMNPVKRKAFEKLITAQLLSFIDTQEQKSSYNSNFKSKCFESLNNYFVFPNALELVRDQLGYNKIYFCRKFKQTFRCTPTEMINSLRLNYAAYLLSTTNYSLQQCCDAIGILSPSYFIKIFKQKFKMSPSAYKKLYRTPDSP